MRKGDIGAKVRDLQTRLGIEADGWYGDNTEAAVRAFQRSTGLAEDGIAGPQTMAALVSGTRHRLAMKQNDILAAADALQVEPAIILAVTEVEAKSHGFLDDGRPVILFERHEMFRQLANAGYDADALAARYPNLVNRKRGGYAGGSAEHARLNAAAKLDYECAVSSASWGMFQLMGHHWPALGYPFAGEMVRDMEHSEGRQLQAFVRFILANPEIHKALKARKWAAFARLYNGPAYKDHDYDTRLARAFTRHAGAGAGAGAGASAGAAA